MYFAASFHKVRKRSSVPPAEAGQKGNITDDLVKHTSMFYV